MIDTLRLRNRLTAAGMELCAAEAWATALARALRQARLAAQSYPRGYPLPSTSAAFDTLQFRNELLAGGIPESTANAQTEAIREVILDAWEYLR